MKNRFKKFQRFKKGFGLMEVLLSCVIIIIILSALITIGRAAMSNSEYLAERAQAIYLAQEGIEMTRQIRDTNWIDGDNTTQWDSLVWNEEEAVPVSIGDHDYIVSLVGSRIRLISRTTDEKIAVNSVDFYRKISIVYPVTGLLPNGTGPDLKQYAMKVTATVTWKYSGQEKTISASEILTNWRPNF